MRTIGIAGPISLQTLNLKKRWNNMPSCYSFPILSHLVNYLMEHEYKIVVYTSSNDINKPIVHIDGNLKICIAPKKKYGLADDYLQNVEFIKSLILTNPSDIIYANWSYEFSYASLISGLPTLIVLHDHAQTIFDISPNHNKLIKYLLNELVLTKAKKIIVVSNYLYSLLSEEYKIKAKVIPNFFPSRLKEKFKHYRDKENYMISINNGFGKRKNVKTAIQAFKLFCDQHPNTNYIYHLIGDDMQYLGPAYNYAMSINAPIERFIFHGHLEYNKAMDILANAKLLIHTSLEESFGMVVLEATILGTPVLGGINSGNVANMMENRGLLCDICIPDEVAKWIGFSSQNEDIMTNMALYAYSTNSSLYEDSTVIPHILNEIINFC